MNTENYLNWVKDKESFEKRLEEIDNDDIKFQIRYSLYHECIFLRKLNYPSLEEQLDILYHSGFEEWKSLISDIKTKYPLPEKLVYNLEDCDECSI